MGSGIGTTVCAAPVVSRSDTLPQLPAPQNLKIHLYNAEQVLSWEPVTLSNDSSSDSVAYRVQYKYSNSEWDDLTQVDCTRIPACNFTAASHWQGFPRHFNVSLRVRAELGELVSAWAAVPWFEHYRNVTIGPPENIRVSTEEDSLIIGISTPFDIDTSMVAFQYYVYYWEEAGTQQVKGPIKNNFILLDGLKPLSVYCFQVKAELVWPLKSIFQPGRLSNPSCYKTSANAATQLQQAILIFVGIFLSVTLLITVCFFLALKYRGVIKYWVHSPPKIPLQIEEFLNDPAHPVLEALDKESSPKEDAWVSVSILSLPGKEPEDAL
ncbi:interferon gamma receptor 2 [Echinops telfairi]|uniref:Interferon gamma receptor 2 n=1 Tax=Echinops telfairi TaxID=9371 RepID=A0ABM0IZB9_ECHTE|nr:interferon gamma receptor 2 [Echinops telfairi]